MKSLAGVLGLLLVTAVAGAQPADAITVAVGETVTFALPRQPQIIGVEDATIASLEVLPDGHAKVTGRREGRTRIVGRDHAQVPMIFGVKVVAPPPPASP